MSAVTRAFLVGAYVASRDGYASQQDLATLVQRTHPAICKLIRRTEEKAIASKLDLWDPILYENDLHRGRSALLTREQKDAIVKLVTSTRNNREKESWQAIKDGNFNEIIPQMSITTFENVMYEAGYARRRPGWKPSLTLEQVTECYEWALEHNPDRYEIGDGLGYDFRKACFTDETPARIGEERGMQRVWCKDGERYDTDVKKDRNRKDCALQFYGAFRYNHKGPCHVYWHETEEEKKDAEEVLKKENTERQHSDNSKQNTARRVLNVLKDSDVNLRRSTRKKQYVPSRDDYKRGNRIRGGVDGYKHREGALKKVVPWINSLKEKGIECILLQDGAPSLKSRISRDYLTVQFIDTMICLAIHQRSMHLSMPGLGSDVM
jgi:hypothetical protein